MRHLDIIKYRSGVYKITNTKNSKIYVGSSVNVYNRMHTHFTKLKKGVHANKHLQAAYNKYGRQVFSFEILEYCNNFTEREQYYINSLNPDYNHRIIAQNNKGLTVSIKTREKIRNTLKKAYASGLVAYKQQHAWRAVEQYDLQGNYLRTFPNLAEAERVCGIYAGKLSVGVKKSSKQTKGFQWKYQGDGKEILKTVNTTSPRARAVLIINLLTGEKISKGSFKDACLHLGICLTTGRRYLDSPHKLYLNTYKIQYHDQYKSCELLENPVEGNQQPSLVVMQERFND